MRLAARLFLLLFCALSSFYALLCYTPFTWNNFIVDARYPASIGFFLHLHGLLLAAAAAWGTPARVVRAIGLAEKKYSAPAYRVLSSVHKYALISRGELGRGYGACYGHNFAAVICADLKMYICCHMRGLKKYSLGNLKKKILRRFFLRKVSAVSNFFMSSSFS